MDAPSIAGVTPNTATVSGQRIVVITGARFRTEFPPLPMPVQPPFRPSVAVFFGDIPATKVLVLSATELRAIVPPSAQGTVDVRVVNLERDGSEVPGEYVVLTAGFTYEMQDLSAKGDEGTLALVTRCLRKLIVQRLMQNTSITVHTDFDGTPLNEEGHLELAKLPALVITGPRCEADRRRSRNAHKTEALPDGTVRVVPPTYTAMLTYTATILTDSTRELLTLQSAFVRFVEDNLSLPVPAEAGGFVQLEVRFQAGGVPSAQLRPTDTNVRQVTAMIQVLGVDIDAEKDAAIDLTAPVADDYTPGGATATLPGAGFVFTTAQVPKP